MLLDFFTRSTKLALLAYPVRILRVFPRSREDIVFHLERRFGVWWRLQNGARRVPVKGYGASNTALEAILACRGSRQRKGGVKDLTAGEHRTHHHNTEQRVLIHGRSCRSFLLGRPKSHVTAGDKRNMRKPFIDL